MPDSAQDAPARPESAGPESAGPESAGPESGGAESGGAEPVGAESVGPEAAAEPVRPPAQAQLQLQTQPQPEPAGIPWQRPMTKFALASVATGLFGLWPLAAGFGITALVKVRRGRRGKGLAIAGLVLSVVGALVTVVQFTGADRDGGGELVLANALEAGDCFSFAPHDPLSAQRLPDEAGRGTIPAYVQLAPCDVPHNGEVTAVAAIGRNTYQEQELRRLVTTTCDPAAAGYRADLWSLPGNVGPGIYYPANGGRAADERKVHCFFSTDTGTVTGSLRTAVPGGAAGAYLLAVRPYNAAVCTPPQDWPEVAGSFSWLQWQEYAGGVAAAEDRSADALRGAALPEAQRPAADALVDGLVKDAELWRQVGAAATPTAQKQAVEAAEQADSVLEDLAVPLRRALGLSTSPSDFLYAL